MNELTLNEGVLAMAASNEARDLSQLEREVIGNLRAMAPMAQRMLRDLSNEYLEMFPAVEGSPVRLVFVGEPQAR